jgi:hypothetical protein
MNMIMGGCALAFVDVDEVHTYAVVGECTDNRTERGCGTTAASDDLAEIVRMNPHLEELSLTAPASADRHVVRIVDDAPDQVL